jgi:AhpD family alkylhydroperoxidase
MALTDKEIELVYLGASIAAGCKPCTSYHFRKAKEAGVLDEEIKNAIAFSVSIRDAAKMEMEKHALDLLKISTQPMANTGNFKPDRTKILISIGSAFAVNCTSTLNDYIALSESAGISSEDLKNIFRATLLIKRKASSHDDRITLRFEEQNGKSNNCGCDQVESIGQTKSDKFDTNVEKHCC